MRRRRSRRKFRRHGGWARRADVRLRCLGARPAWSGGYVLKLAPSNVTRRGNTDVYRQAPLLRALHRAGLPVPAVPWASPDEALLGSPFIIMERLPGRVFLVWEPHGSFPRPRSFCAEIWLQAARLLAQLHRIDWRAVVARLGGAEAFARRIRALAAACCAMRRRPIGWRPARSSARSFAESVPTDIPSASFTAISSPAISSIEDGRALRRDRLGAGLDRLAGARRRLDADDVGPEGLEPRLAAGRAGERRRNRRGLSSTPAALPGAISNGIRRSRTIGWARSLA